MTQIKVMKLWTAFVTAFLALCTALGLITVTATTAAATPRPETTGTRATAQVTTPALSPWAWAFTRSLPPTMKQRIRAEAHGKSPSCRHRPPADTDEAMEAIDSSEPDHTEPTAPLQR
nr:DUF6344 domain-containing protein [Streptomyces sp. NBC_00886]